MLDALKFVKGAVSTKDYVPTLTHFCIQSGHVKGYNGVIALCHPLSLDIQAKPKALPFVKAIETCKDVVSLNLTPTGRLSVKSGKFRAYVECTEEPYPEIFPEGQCYDVKGDFLTCLKTLKPFIAKDDSRRWARGIKFEGSSAFATNNVILVQYWLGTTFPLNVNIPEPAVNEIIRINMDPIRLQANETSLTLHYKDGCWLRTQLYNTQWPDLSLVFDRCSQPDWKVIPLEFWDSLKDIEPFTNEGKKVYLDNGLISTSQVEGTGASVVVDNLIGTGAYNIEFLRSLEKVAEYADFTKYPEPCMFTGNKGLIRGVVMGMT